jgi:hypothetical protein
MGVQNRSCLGGGCVFVGGGKREIGKECIRWLNKVQILCTHVCEWKTIPIETIPGMGERRIKENGGGSECKNNIFDIL